MTESYRLKLTEVFKRIRYRVPNIGFSFTGVPTVSVSTPFHTTQYSSTGRIPRRAELDTPQREM